jgi:hypothetical protein
MREDQRYECALSAALVILGEIDAKPDMPRHNRLAIIVFSILHAMDCWEQERAEPHIEFSVN